MDFMVVGSEIGGSKWWSSRQLVDWAQEEDALALENAPQREGDDWDPRELGPRLRSLREIAQKHRATKAVRYIDGIAAGTWPPPPKPPRIIAVVGVKARRTWIRTWCATFRVITDRGPAYLYPPRENGTATLGFGEGFSGVEVRLSRHIQRELALHALAFEQLQAKRTAEWEAELKPARDS